MVAVGAACLILFAFYIWGEYASFLNKGSMELGEFIRFIEYMKERMECYLEAPVEWVSGFSSEELEELGFLRDIREGKDLFLAYKNCADSSCIDTDAKTALSDLFSNLGDGYLNTEVSIIKSSLDKLSKLDDTVKKERINKTKAAGAMLGAVAVGIIILIL